MLQLPVLPCDRAATAPGHRRYFTGVDLARLQPTSWPR